MTEMMMSLRPICLRGAAVVGLVTFLAILTTVPAISQERQLELTAEYEIDDLDLQPSEESIELSLDDALTLALERNLSLLVQRYQYNQSILGIDENRGIYDLQFDASFTRSGETSPVTSTLVEADDIVTSSATPSSFTLSQLVRTGGIATLDWGNNRSATNNQRQTTNPLYSTGLNLDLTQPLLRNYGRLVTERNLIIAKTNRAISRELLQVEVERVLQEVSDSYWFLVESRSQLAVAEESLNLAKELHEMNRIQVEVGTLPPLDMVQSEAGVATREEEIIRRRADVEDFEDRLRQLLNFDQGELWEVSIIPISDPEIPFREIDYRESIKAALELRSDLQRQRLEIENQEVNLQVARNQARPRLDLNANIGYSGVGGNSLLEDGTIQPGGYSDAVDQLTARDFENWQVGLTFSYPLQNRTAKARRAIAELARKQGDIELSELEQTITTDVRRAVRAVRTAAQQIESAKVSSRLAAENLNAEEKRYENGISTSFQILRIQEDLSDARRREVTAIAAYRRALIDYFRVTGQMLSEMNVLLSEPVAEEDVSTIER